MNIFEFTDYKILVQKLFETRPKRGHGQYRKLAEALRLSSVAVSQIFRGARELSPEQALETARFLRLGSEETEYFLLLVQRARAGTPALREHLDAKLAHLREERERLAARVKRDATLSDSAKAVFYSDWKYSAVRIASSIPGLSNVDAVAERLGLAPADVENVVRFLLENGMCVGTPQEFSMGPSSTMLAADSPFINGHRRNWRIKGLNQLRNVGASDLFYSGFVSLSKADLKKLRQELVETVTRFTERVKDSPSETLACLNLDWFELER